MTTKPLKRLSSLEIDEVSLVDRPANQHGLVTITKRDEGLGMAVYDAQGNEIDESQLQSGDQVFDEDGEIITMLSDEDLQDLLDSGEVDADDLEIVGTQNEYESDGATPLDDRDLVGVGKGLRSAGAAVTGGASTLLQTGRKTANRAFGEVKTGYRNQTKAMGEIEGRGQRVGAHLGRNRARYGVAAAAGGEENARGRVRKSLGEQVLSDLSKALTDGDRDTVVSKLADRLDQAEQTAYQAVTKAEELENEREFAQYCEIAKGFELPVDPEDLGGILQQVSKVLNDEQLDTLERILHTAAAALDFEERGSAGGSPLMAYVGEAATEMVGKSAGGISEAEATTALFSANDDAYLAYLSENQR